MKNLKYQLQNCDLTEVFKYLKEMHEYTGEKVKINDIIFTYMKMINELIGKFIIAVPEDQYTLYVSYVAEDEDIFSPDPYINVRIKNEKFVEPYPKDGKMWGGNEKDKNDCPQGSYNINWEGYQEYYAISGMDREKYLLNDIIVEDDVWNNISELHPEEKIVAEILWELSFHGILEETCVNFWGKLDERDGDVPNLSS